MITITNLHIDTIAITGGSALMATLAEIQQMVSDIHNEVQQTSDGVDVMLAKMATLAADIDALKAQIAAGTAATPADMDVLAAALADVKTQLQAVIAKEVV